MPLPWWRLPFAGALSLHGVIIRRCQLCQVNQCQILPVEAVKRGCNEHWFNRLQYLCLDCHQRVNWCQSTFNIDVANLTIKGIASTSYRYPFDDAMRQFKNSQHLAAFLPLVHILRQLPIPAHCNATNSVIIPVPTTLARIRARGFAPLYWLAQYLSFHWQIPLFTGISREERAHQQGLNREERLHNVEGAFLLDELPRVKHLIIFDDVVTTGATLQALATQLIQANQNYRLSAYALLHGNR